MNQLMLFRAIVTSFFLIITQGHVRLTFPPARSYALDFLDNARTPRPCGFPPYSGNDCCCDGELGGAIVGIIFAATGIYFCSGSLALPGKNHCNNNSFIEILELRA